MAGEESSQEKTEDATPRKLRDARKKGQVPKSKDLTSILVMVMAFATLSFVVKGIGARLRGFMDLCFSKIPEAGTSGHHQDVIMPLLKEGFVVLGITMAPFLAVVFFGALLVSYLQIGSAFSLEAIKPNLNKLNPIEGLKNLFKLRQFVELFKSTLKIFLVFTLAYFAVKGRLDELVYTVTSTLLPTLVLSGEILRNFLSKVCIFFVAIALFDLLYQRWQFSKDMRMSKYEVMQEFKRDEGDPMLKSHRRQMHQELSAGDMSRVKKSDVVVVNPIHLAIAIQYDRDSMAAPQVMAKGQRLIAQQIKNIAQESGIPIIENVPLAHALFELPPGAEIPEQLYETMAEVLCFVFRMKEKKVP